MYRGSSRPGLLLAALLAGALSSCSTAVFSKEAPATIEPAQSSCASLPSEPISAPVAWSATSGAVAPPEWCGAVGPAAVAITPADTSVRVEAIVVASWNIRVGAGDVVQFVDDLRAGALTGTPEHHFVLLLQEAYRESPRTPNFGAATGQLTSRIAIPPPSGQRLDVLELARRLGLYLFYVPSMPNGTAPQSGPVEDRGNAVLSTLPLGDLTAIELPFEVQRRVAIAATIRGTTPDGEIWHLRVASGHLDTRSRWSRLLDSFGAGRGRQAKALGENLEGNAVVLGADLNTWSAGFLEGAVEILHARFPDTPELRGHTFVAAGLLKRRLDYLLARLPDDHRVEARLIGSRYGSDHFPVLGIVRFHAAAPVPAMPGHRADRLATAADR